MKFLEKLFFVKNENSHRVIGICGLKIKYALNNIIKYNFRYIKRCNKNLKIFCTYHYPDNIPIFEKLYWYIPISTGALTNTKFKNILQDNLEQNISNMNEIFADLTAQYWIWKNVKGQYVGIENHNKHFLFDPNKKKKRAYYPISIEAYSKIFQKYNVKEIYKIIEQYDIILPYKQNFNNITLIEQYKIFHNELNYANFEKILVKNNPQYAKYIYNQRKLTDMYLCNIKIMKKELFNQFCSFIFPSLFEYASCYDCKNEKYPAWFNERFFNAWLNYQIDNNDIKILEMESCSIQTV